MHWHQQVILGTMSFCRPNHRNHCVSTPHLQLRGKPRNKAPAILQKWVGFQLKLLTGRFKHPDCHWFPTSPTIHQGFLGFAVSIQKTMAMCGLYPNLQLNFISWVRPNSCDSQKKDFFIFWANVVLSVFLRAQNRAFRCFPSCKKSCSRSCSLLYSY